MKSIIFAACLLLTSCSLTMQNGVRSAGLDCSTSRAYWITDVVFAAALATLGSQMDPSEVGYVPAGVYLGSALLGGYKRGNCVEYRGKATPEMWTAHRERKAHEAEEREKQRQEEAARLEALAEALEAKQAELEAEEAQRRAAEAATPPPAATPTDWSSRSSSSSSSSSTPPASSSSSPSSGGRAASTGACRCKGYPMGHPKAAETRTDQKCIPMSNADAAGCLNACLASGYGAYTFNGLDSCN